MRNNSGGEYFRAFLELEAKKDKLFIQGLHPGWELQPHNLTEDVLMKNKDLAKALMLPKVIRISNRTQKELKRCKECLAILILSW